MDDTADHPPVIGPRLAARVSQQTRFELGKPGVSQLKPIGNHWRFLSEAVDHDAATPTRFMGLAQIHPLPGAMRDIPRQKTGFQRGNREWSADV
jgi:hypothetical protein